MLTHNRRDLNEVEIAKIFNLHGLTHVPTLYTSAPWRKGKEIPYRTRPEDG